MFIVCLLDPLFIHRIITLDYGIIFFLCGDEMLDLIYWDFTEFFFYFASVFIRDIGLCFLFLLSPHLVFISWWCWPHRMSLERPLPLKFFLRLREKIVLVLKVWQNPPVKPSRPRLSLVERVFWLLIYSCWLLLVCSSLLCLHVQFWSLICFQECTLFLF